MSDDTVKNYLEHRPEVKHPRVKCCNSSRSLYCPVCCALLVETDHRPPPISLPCKLDIVLDEKNRAKSTGIHAKCLIDAQEGLATCVNECALYDIERGDALPDYNVSDSDGTFILFPVPGESVPLASVAANINQLVVLDCKWTKSSCKDRPELQNLPKVHLSEPPEKSYFWRWHSQGPGMISTIEAIYYASLEVSEHKRSIPKDERENLIHLLYLFAEQRISIQRSCEESGGKTTPFSEKGKEEQRALRRYKGTEKQARDKKRGKLLKEFARKQREAADKQGAAISSLSQQVANINI